MTELIIGVAVGVAGMYAKDKYLGNTSTEKLNAKQRELDNVYNENETFRKRNKDLSRQVEDLQFEIDKLRRQSKARNDHQDNLEDDLEDAKTEVKKLHMQNDELYRKLQEYKSACEAYELEIANLKQNNKKQ